MQPGLSFDESAGLLLETVSSIVDAPGYYLYLAGESTSGGLSLKAMRTEQEAMRAQIQYGEFPADQSAYVPPLELAMQSQPAGVGFAGVKEHCILAIPIPGRDGSLAGVVHAGPIRQRDVNTSTLRLLSDMRAALGTALSIMEESSVIRHSTDSLTGRLEAMSIAAQGAFEPLRLVHTLVSLGARLTGSDTWLLAVFDEYRSRSLRPIAGGVPETVAREVIRNLSAARSVRSLPARIERVDTAGGLGQTLSPLFLHSGRQEAIWVPLVRDACVVGALICLPDSSVPLEDHGLLALDALTSRLVGVLENSDAQDRVTFSYLESLRALAAFMDSQDTHSRGHSARVSRLARDIAGEMDLAPGYRQAVELAGYLHDIGTCALKGELITAGRRLTRTEYDEMKSHAVVGAALVEAVNDPVPLAPLIRHHHERYDGSGYPDGLRGEIIPIGARIIAVADVFNAKISSRSYRHALTFERAVEEMGKSKGTMLDPKCVDALLSSIERKQRRIERIGRTLEPCWEMTQCPQFAREHCPVRSRDCLCWTIAGDGAGPRGLQCGDCLVFTEYQYRVGTGGGARGR
ncbi:MAG: HD-GYP domain-containing protein [Bacillota bacterium]